MVKKDIVPKMRFRCFRDEWKECRFSDIYTKNYGGGTPSTKNKDYWYNGTLPWYQSSDLIEGKLVNKKINKKITIEAINETSAKKVPGGSIAIVTRVGVGKLSFIDFDYSTSQDFMSISGLKVNDMYAVYLIYRLMYHLKNRLQGTSIKGITKSELDNQKLLITRNDLEQKKIGSFFTKTDKLIGLQIQKLEQLKKLKKGYLQKIFPQEEESLPRLRFSGFSGEWEEEKMGSIAKIYRGASPRPIKDKKWFDDNSKVGWIRISDVTCQHGRITKLSQHLSKEGQKKTRVLKESHLLLSIAASVGKPVINYVETGVHDGFLIFDDPQFNIDYMYYFLEYYQNRWDKFGQPGSQVNLNSEIVKSLSLFLPDLDEQKKIALFIKSIDQMVENQTNKIDVLKQQKKAYLQKMFI
ncbi:restriction endonuclease subunit S [Apilactobacillus kunkeei]|uniref:restriction endonuclease subunit S n=1 Tax=Apilactobacillus kunkeei TaxID=148814 RepID=UPI0006B251CE|nr:restriction endonuclease subunit S [Apilactobacillus kunkeei]